MSVRSCLKQHVQFIKKLSNTEPESKKCVAYKKSVYAHFHKRKLLSLAFLNETLLVKLSKNLVFFFSDGTSFSLSLDSTETSLCISTLFF